MSRMGWSIGGFEEVVVHTFYIYDIKIKWRGHFERLLGFCFPVCVYVFFPHCYFIYHLCN
jgi:hypothetical protein